MLCAWFAEVVGVQACALASVWREKMSLTRLDHFTINCADLDRSRRFYSEVLGMADGDRPPFGFPGAWLYVGDRPVVHLVGGQNEEGISTTGSVDHVAFAANDLPT